MLVPPSEWPLKPNVHPYTPAKSPKYLRDYCTKLHEIFTRRRGMIVNLKATIGVAIFPWCWMPAHRMKMGCVNFRRHVPQLSYIVTSLERDVAISIYYYKTNNQLYNCWKFGKHQSRNSGENNANVRIFQYVQPPTPCKSVTRPQRLLVQSSRHF